MVKFNISSDGWWGENEILGDEPSDIMGDALEKIVESYQNYWKRSPTKAEMDLTYKIVSETLFEEMRIKRVTDGIDWSEFAKYPVEKQDFRELQERRNKLAPLLKIRFTNNPKDLAELRSVREQLNNYNQDVRNLVERLRLKSKNPSDKLISLINSVEGMNYEGFQRIIEDKITQLETFGGFLD
jgi:hypothetical protein